MKTLYLECGMGAAGDMLTAALLDLFKEPEQIIDKLKQYIPEEFNTYYEPFVGGGALLFELVIKKMSIILKKYI